MITDDVAIIIQRGKQKSTDLASAVASGVVGRSRVLYEDQGYLTKLHETPVIIGLWPTTLPVLKLFHGRPRPFVTIDNGYFRPYTQGGYYRATTNALQWFDRKPSDADAARLRFEALGETIAPWREPGDGYILVAMQSDRWMNMMAQPEWWFEAQRRLPELKGRAIVYRHKPGTHGNRQPSLEEHLKGCAAVIGFSSNTLVRAAMAGVPVFPLAPCAASAFGLSDVSQIESPIYPDRAPILHQLAANQWTADEIASGLMWNAMVGRYENKFMELA